MKLCADLRLSLWIIGLFICITMSYNLPDDGLMLTDDTLRKTNGDRMIKMNVDDNNGLAARKRSFWTDYKSSSLDTPVFGDLRTLPEPQNSRASKQGPQHSLSEKRAYMHDPFMKMSEQLETVANTLNTLGGDVQTMKSEFAAKLKEISEKQKPIAGTLDTCTLTGEVANMKSEFGEKLNALTGDINTMKSDFAIKFNDLKTISAKQNANTDTLNTLTKDVTMIKSELMAMVEVLKTNADKSDDQSTLSDKTTNMNGQFKTTSEPVEANSDNLLIEIHGRLARPSSCLDYLNAGYTKSGEYRITIPSTNQKLTVYCDQETDGGGWLVFQRRQDGSVDFYRDWNFYKTGFGNVNGEFWLGNDNLHSLTRDPQELRVDLVDFDGNTAYVKYALFSVGSESENYTLHVSVSSSSEIAKDSLQLHNGKDFLTKDRGNDGGSCARHFKGGWWYDICSYQSNLNGLYYHSANRNHGNCIRWGGWKPESLKKTEMKIRPK